jgi:hypothetical protein
LRHDDCALEGSLGCGTTWHAAGLIGQLRANETETKLSRYGIQLYADLEKETGQVHAHTASSNNRREGVDLDSDQCCTVGSNRALAGSSAVE